MKAVIYTIVVAILCKGFEEVVALSAGAPSSACANLMPNPTSHGAQPQSSAVPYSIDLSPFNNSYGGYEYYPGQTYNLTLSGNSGEQFRGLLVQTRTVADDSNVGTFAVLDVSNTRLSSCSPTSIGITHSNGNDKNYTTFEWTAPAQGTGALRFRFAVVQVQNTYWADQSSAMVQEQGAAEVTTTDSGASNYSGIGVWMLLQVAILVSLVLY